MNWITGRIEKEIVSGVSYSNNESKITISGIPDQPGIAANIFGILATNNIDVDMIVQNISQDGVSANITFTVSTKDTKFAKKFRNIDLYPKSLAQFFKENKKKWNIISFFGVLEHLPEPMTALKISNKLLSKNGIIVLAVPNYDSISTDVLQFLIRCRLHL